MEAVKNETMCRELENNLIELFEKYCENLELKKGSKNFFEAQRMFFLGASASIDKLLENKKSCITPNVYFSILRNDIIKKIE